MTVYARLETAAGVTVLAMEEAKCDSGWAILRWLEERHPGERDHERDRRWAQMQRGEG